MSNEATIKYLVELGVELERCRRITRRLRRRNQRMCKEIENMRRQRETRNVTSDVPDTDDERPAPSGDYDVLLPLDPPDVPIEEWRSQHKMFGRPLRLSERFRHFMKHSVAFLLDGSNVLITGPGLLIPTKEGVQEFAPVAHILCCAADAAPGDALGLVVERDTVPVVHGRGFLLPRDVTADLMQCRMLPAGPTPVGSFLVTNARNAADLRSVLGYADQ